MIGLAYRPDIQKEANERILKLKITSSWYLKQFFIQKRTI